MKKIVVLGNSVAGVKALEGIRAFDQTSEMTLLALDGHYPYNRELFSQLIAKGIPPNQMFYKSKDFYDAQRIRVILDKKVTRINFKKNKIFTENREQIDYDILLITDSPDDKFPDIKGTHKTGVFGIKKFRDIDQIINGFPLTDTVIIQADSFSGLQAAVACVKRDKEAVLIISDQNFLQSILDPQIAVRLFSVLKNRGLHIISGNPISELLGDGDVKAVRLCSGKVLASQMVFFGETYEDMRLFSDSSLQMNEKIFVDAQFKSNLDNVFACDSVCEREHNEMAPEDIVPLAVLEEQGKIVAAAINGQDCQVGSPLILRSLYIEGLSMSLLGHMKPRGDFIENRKTEDELIKYKKVFMEGHCLIGAVLINADNEKDKFMRLIKEKINIEGIEDCVLDENYDYQKVLEELSRKDLPTTP